MLNLYFRQRKRAIFIFCLFAFIFFITFYLYDLPVAAVLYPVAVCGGLGLLIFLWDIRKVKEKHEVLTELAGRTAALMEHLPPIQSQDDADYRAIIECLRQEQAQLQSRQAFAYQSMVDYYTVWVHQIKTPIAAMRLTLQNEDSALSRQLHEELQRIEQYVEMVLVFLRLDSTTKDYVFREQDLDGIVKEAVKKFAGQFIRKKIKLCYEPLHIKVLTDEKWLIFVLEQVLSNALKYTNSGSITITLEEPLTLCIRDTGIGIAPEDLPRVFEKSYTGYNGRTDRKASGIGLYLCKRICDNLGHRITIESSIGTADTGTSGDGVKVTDAGTSGDGVKIIDTEISGDAAKPTGTEEGAGSGTVVRIYLEHEKMTLE